MAGSDTGRPLAIFGGRGAGLHLAETVFRMASASGRPLRVAGFLNDLAEPGSRIEDYPVLGPFEAWQSLPTETVFAAPLHKVLAMPNRAAKILGLDVPENRWLAVLDPSSVVARSVSYGSSIFVCAFSHIQPGVRIGRHVTIREGAGIGHDWVLDDFVFVGANSVVCGYCRLQTGAYVAPGAVIRESVTIGKFAIVGLGAVVTRDVPDGALVRDDR